MIVRNGKCYAENPMPVLKITGFETCGPHQMRVVFNDDASMLDLVHIRNGVRSIVMRDVDVVSRRGLSPFLGKRILSEAVAL